MSDEEVEKKLKSLEKIEKLGEERETRSGRVIESVFNKVRFGTEAERDMLRSLLGSDIYREAEIAASIDAKAMAIFDEEIFG